MATSRPTPQQITTDLPLEAAREATWQGFVEAGVKTPIIDRAKNIVVGSTGDGFLSVTRDVTARFATRSEETLVSLSSKNALGGVVDFGIGKRSSKKIADAIDKVLARGWTRPPAVAAPGGDVIEVTSVAPIAEPTAQKIAMPTTGPIYGVAMPARLGNTVMFCAILGLFIPSAAPIALIYANKALKNYGDIDPGDKSLVNTSRIMGIIGCVLLVVWIVVPILIVRNIR